MRNQLCFAICLVFSTSLWGAANAEPAQSQANTSSSPVHILNSTLYCKFSGTVGSMYFENSGDRPYFNCTAHCEWVSSATRFNGDFSGFDIGKNEKQTKWTKDYGQTIIRSENAKLTCN
jgi:hypothetical protein